MTTTTLQVCDDSGKMVFEHTLCFDNMKQKLLKAYYDNTYHISIGNGHIYINNHTIHIQINHGLLMSIPLSDSNMEWFT